MTYAEWLEKNGYRPSTIERGVRRAKQMWSAVEMGEPLDADSNMLAEGRRLLLWLDEGGGDRDMGCSKAALRKALDVLQKTGERLRATPLAKRRAQQAQAQRKEPSYPDADWRKLHEHLVEQVDTEGDLRAAVLLVLMGTGLRAADVLAITRGRLDGGLRSGTIRIIAKGGEEYRLKVEDDEDWSRLADLWQGRGAGTVAALLATGADDSPIAGHTPYKRLRARLVDAHARLRLTGRPHLHRLRRTVLVQAARETKDLELVRQLGRHKSLSTTLRYVDEARPEELADLQKKLKRRLEDE